jgi:hypothetical protein
MHCPQEQETKLRVREKPHAARHATRSARRTIVSRCAPHISLVPPPWCSSDTPTARIKAPHNLYWHSPKEHTTSVGTPAEEVAVIFLRRGVTAELGISATSRGRKLCWHGERRLRTSQDLKARCAQLISYHDRYGAGRSVNSDGAGNQTRIADRARSRAGPLRARRCSDGSSGECPLWVEAV